MNRSIINGGQLLVKAVLVSLAFALIGSNVRAADPVDAECFVTVEFYDDIEGVSTFDLYGDPKWPDNPDRSLVIPGLSAFPGPYGDNYGAKATGRIVITEAGSYDFFLRSDDASDFFFNRDGPAIPDASGTPLLFEEDCCDPFIEPDVGDDATTFSPIQLAAGEYGFCLVWKEGGGGDWAQVAMRNVNDTTPAASLSPIGSQNVIGLVDIEGSTAEITSQPTGGEFSENENVTLTVGLNFESPVVDAPLIQWFKDGVAVGGANSASLTMIRIKKDQAGTYKATVCVPGTFVESDEVVVTVTDDVKPPEIHVGNLVKDGKHEIGVGFSEPVNPDTLAGAEVTVSAGTVDSIEVATRSTDGFSPDIDPSIAAFPYGNLKAIVSGLTAGESVTVTVKGVEDVAGNAIDPAAEATITAAEEGFTWTVVGAATAAFSDEDDAVALGDGAFDIYATGVGFWADYDEATYAYEPVTGPFDKVVQVVYQDTSSQWGRIGLDMREGLDEGKPDPSIAYPDCPSPIDPDTGENCIPTEDHFSRHQSCHVNPNVTWSNGTGNNGWENNYRNTDTIMGGNQSRGANGGGGPLTYPNAWCRIARDGDMIMTYRSTDGVAWTPMTEREFPELNETVFIGLLNAPELNNNGTLDGLGHSTLAQYRNYGDYDDGSGGSVITGITLNADGTFNLDGEGTAGSSADPAGPYNGEIPLPATGLNASQTQLFYAPNN